MTTIQKLRTSGYKVRVNHFRNVATLINWNKINYSWYPQGTALKIKNGFLCPRGGRTIVTLTTPDDKTYTATAICGKKDMYNKKLGVAICVGRILQQMENNESRTS